MRIRWAAHAMNDEHFELERNITQLLFSLLSSTKISPKLLCTSYNLLSAVLSRRHTWCIRAHADFGVLKRATAKTRYTLWSDGQSRVYMWDLPNFNVPGLPSPTSHAGFSGGCRMSIKVDLTHAQRQHSQYCMSICSGAGQTLRRATAHGWSTTLTEV